MSAPTPNDEKDTPKKAPISALGAVTGRIAARLMRARREKISVQPRVTPGGKAAHLKHQPHIHARMDARNEGLSKVDADGNLPMSPLVFRASNRREFAAANTDRPSRRAKEKAVELTLGTYWPRESG
jgi:hypothetical protein